MKPVSLTNQQVLILRGLAERRVLTDDRNPKVPDNNEVAYATGLADGEALLARRLLAAAGK